MLYKYSITSKSIHNFAKVIVKVLSAKCTLRHIKINSNHYTDKMPPIITV